MGVIERFVSDHTAEPRDEVLGRTGRLGFVAIGVLLVFAGPFFQSVDRASLFLLIEILVFALFVLSFDFAFGHGGLPSFGHAAMFGGGGYAVALMLTEVTQSLFAGIALAFLVGVVVAGLIGWISVRAGGVYFAFLTLAFAQMLYIVASNDIPAELLGVERVTGGANGIYALPRYTLLGTPVDFSLTYYYVVFVAVAVSLVLVVRIANSPFGRVMLGIRENEDRIAFVGYDVDRYKTIAFAISGGFAGLAGGLFVPFQSIATPGLFFWTTSGEVFIMALLGGAGSIWGPMLGAALVRFIEDTFAASSLWQFVLGSVYVVVVIFSPNGLAGIVVSLKEDPGGALDNARRSLATYVRKVRGS